MFLFRPSEVFDPVWCRNTRWIIAIAAVVNGNGKCNAKNRVSVALYTVNPRTNWTISFLMYVTADSSLEITVAPQDDICPHSSTYSMNTVAVFRNRITTTTTDHVCTRLYDWQ